LTHENQLLNETNPISQFHANFGTEQALRDFHSTIFDDIPKEEGLFARSLVPEEQLGSPCFGIPQRLKGML
jgi:hypothetical protein